MPPKPRRALKDSMRFRRKNRRALAEIVGTLMLVVIVVAAATAFSFFVAAYQKQLQAQETLSHDRALEDLKVIDVTEVSCADFSLRSYVGCLEPGVPTDSFANISFLVASLDVNTIWITGLFLNGQGVVTYNATYGNGTQLHPCFNPSAFVGGEPLSGLVLCAPLALPPYSTVKLTLDVDEDVPWAPAFGGTSNLLLPSSDLNFQILTQLTNLFTETFSPPDAIASVFFVSDGSSSVPVFDGLSSYQPASANNASILAYVWTIFNNSSKTTMPPPPSGAEIELPYPLEPGTIYLVNLTVTNTDGLSGMSSLTYVEPS